MIAILPFAVLSLVWGLYLLVMDGPDVRAWWYPGTQGPMQEHPFRVVVMDKPTRAVQCTGWYGDPDRARAWAEVCAQTPNRRVGLVRMERLAWGIRRWTLVESWISREPCAPPMPISMD